VHLAQQHRYFIVHKPREMVSQFVSPHAVRLLGDLDFNFPEGTHAIGRLDNHSEGLLLLTTNKTITRLLLQPPHKHKRTYHVMVKGIVTNESIEKLRAGISIRTGQNEYYTTEACDADIINASTYPDTREQNFFASATTWISITLTEGKFHQVRKMVSSIGHPCRRLLRVSIEDLELGDLQAGQVREIEEGAFFKLLHLTK
jgi:23S rRNA pseudouridine2457 synthase